MQLLVAGCELTWAKRSYRRAHVTKCPARHETQILCLLLACCCSRSAMHIFSISFHFCAPSRQDKAQSNRPQQAAGCIAEYATKQVTTPGLLRKLMNVIVACTMHKLQYYTSPCLAMLHHGSCYIDINHSGVVQSALASATMVVVCRGVVDFTRLPVSTLIRPWYLQ